MAEPDDGTAPDPEQAPRLAASPSGRAGGSGAVSDGAGVFLGFLLWVWVVLPFLKGGPSNVGAVLRAKLTNKGPDGKALP